jgi:hypothetical protein
MAGKSKTNSKGPGDENNDPAVYDPTEIETVDLTADSEAGLFDQGLFELEQDEDGRVAVHLRRYLPSGDYTDPITGVTFQADGFLESLPQGITEIADYISKKYGGGSYYVQKRVKGVIRKNIRVRVSGSPRLPQAANQSQPQAQPAAEINPELGLGGNVPTFDVGNGLQIPLTGNLAQLRDMIFMVRALDTVFPKKESINDTLLTLAMQKQGSVSESLDQLVKLKELLGDLGGGGESGGNDWVALISKGLGTLQTLASAGKLSPMPKGTVLNQPTAPQLSAPNNNDNRSAGEDPSGAESQEVPTMTGLKERAMYAVMIIIRNYQLGKPAERVIVQIDNAVPITAEEKEQLKPHRDLAFDSAENELADYLLEQDDPDAERAKFKKYFDSVFDLFVDPEREAKIL